MTPRPAARQGPAAHRSHRRRHRRHWNIISATARPEQARAPRTPRPAVRCAPKAKRAGTPASVGPMCAMSEAAVPATVDANALFCQRRRENTSAAGVKMHHGRMRKGRPRMRGLVQVGCQAQLCSSINEPAFPSRPGITLATARSVGDGRSIATRSTASMASTGPSLQ